MARNPPQKFGVYMPEVRRGCPRKKYSMSRAVFREAGGLFITYLLSDSFSHLSSRNRNQVPRVPSQGMSGKWKKGSPGAFRRGWR